MNISYQLILKIDEDLKIQIGKLGFFHICKGTYAYTGSALRNYESRIARHLKKTKPLKWHIDYLTTHKDVNIIAVIRSTLPECTLNQATDGEILIPNFGSSDCKHNCGSHLKKI